MIRSLTTAVSGLRNHQNKLDVVGNNISNVNTLGYKYSTAQFQDVFSQTVRGAAAPQPNQGGVNPIQVGLGMGLSSSTAVHTQGALTSTGRESDLAIEGRGFFVVSDGAQNYYSRDGSFTRDSSGVLVNANGMVLQGWTPVLDEDGNEVIDTAQPLSEIVIPLGEDMIARTTSEMVFSGNLNADSMEGRPSDLTIDRGSGIDRVFTSGLQRGDYTVQTRVDNDTEDEAINVLGEYVQADGVSSWLTNEDLTEDNINASVLMEVIAKDGDLVTFRFDSHQYEKDGTYTKASEIHEVDTSTVDVIDDLRIGALTFSADITGNAAGSGDNYTVGDKVIIDVKAAEAADEQFVEINHGSFDAQWVFDENTLDNQSTPLRFFTMDGRGNLSDGFVSLEVGSALDSSSSPHTTFTFTSEDDSEYNYTTYAYDSLGNQHFLDMAFRKIGANQWEYVITHEDGEVLLSGAEGILHYSTGGRLLAGDSDIPELSFDPLNGAEEVVFTPDFSSTNQLVAESNVITRSQDGSYAGELVAFDVEASGIVSGTYTNGMIKTLGQVPLASFINPEGLIKIGSNLYDASANSGDARIGVAGEDGRGVIQARALEMSNVDLANEFTEMITTNRAFQANSRVITTSDEVLQELVNIKR